ncbi:MAG: serine hydroxymethyltransferase [Kiritimatiellae bacterium]|nr:serine hydroxymethyltransferase [Kiritimatiellia bacterium]
MSNIQELIADEADRQWRNLIMIPSESICNPAAAEVLASPFTNIYAEGRPEPALLPDPRASSADADRFRAWQTRLADGRFYKGCVNADIAELAAQDCIARVFGSLPGGPPAERLFVNVQPLSGAAANTAVYAALLEPGDCILGLDLAHGGHLTHGSPYNLSGKTYSAVSYGIDGATRKLDYDRIRQVALDARPRLIIGGASAYPWDFDWSALRRIADEAGALLMADIAHLAGMVAAGLLANPLGLADIVTFTTHKTLFGPRGAVIITARAPLARRIQAGVFPGLQGGPHVQSIAAIAAHFDWILENKAAFVAQQRAILANARVLSEALTAEGFTLEYGGTDTHMLLVDLKPYRVKGDGRIDGEIASRLLELCGIVCNKNALPGDESGARASGIRMGTPWVTQRGITADQLREIAAVTRLVLQNAHTCRVCVGPGAERCRGRIPADCLDEALARTLAIVQALPVPARPPHAAAARPTGPALLLRGDRTRLALDQMLTCPMADLLPDACADGRLLRPDGTVIDAVRVRRLPDAGSEERFLLRGAPDKTDEVCTWLRRLSDGYVLLDVADLHLKVDGPTVVADAGPEPGLAAPGEPVVCIEKPFFIGQKAAGSTPPPLATYAFERKEEPLRKTVLNALHRELGARMVPFAGWEMPVQYKAGIFAEHQAVRTGAGLFDVSHMSAVRVSGEAALPFLEVLLANCVARLRPGQAQYGYILYPDGTAIDDLYVYRLAATDFMLVLNAANATEDMAWIRAVLTGDYVIDPAMPWKKAPGGVELLDLRDAGEDSLVGTALQGGASRKILAALSDRPGDLRGLAVNRFLRCALAGSPAVIARTGYTGEPVGYELYVHPDALGTLWQRLIEQGAVPCGLGARDSTRIQAGLPLFGHELEGDWRLSLTAAGYGFVPKFHKPFFIGRKAYIDRVAKEGRRVIRLKGAGRKSVREGHAVLEAGGQAAGAITSFAFVDESFGYYAMAAVTAGFEPEPGARVRVVRVPHGKYAGQADEKSVVELEALPRFPSPEEKAGWAASVV